MFERIARMDPDERDRFGVTVTCTVALSALMALAGLLGARSGGYDVYTWTPVAIATALGLAILVAVRPPARERLRGRWRRIGLAAVFAYALWSAIAISWSDNKQLAWEEAARCGFYAALVLGGVLLSRSRTAVRAAIVSWVLATTLVALATLRSLPSSYEETFQGGRLLGALEYYNGEAAFLLVPVLAAVALAAQRETMPIVRALLVGCTCVLVPMAVLPQSRGAALALIAATAIYLVISPQRIRSAIVLAAPAAATALSWGRLNEVHTLLRREQEAAAELTGLVRLIVGVAIGIGLAALLAALADSEWELPARVRTIGTRAVAAACVLAAVTAVVTVDALRSPVREARAALDQAVDPQPAADQAVDGELGRFAVVGNGSSAARVELWRVAWRDLREQPLGGVGPANYERTVYELRDTLNDRYVRQPHNLTLEVLAERGIVGGVLVALLLVSAAVVAMRTRLGDATVETKAVVAGLVGSIAYWLAHAQVDWLWQLSAATVGVMVALGLLLGSPWRYQRRSRTVTAPVRAGLVALLALCALAPVAPMVADRYLHTGEHYAFDDPARAIGALERADRWAPWSPAVAMTLGQAHEQAGDERAAARAFERGRDRNPRHWVPHFVAAGYYRRSGDSERADEAMRRAAQLNPLEPRLANYAD